MSKLIELQRVMKALPATEAEDFMWRAVQALYFQEEGETT